MNIRHDPTESADPDDLVWEPPKTSGFKPGGPVDEDYHNWKCADCPGPHKEDHSIRCQKCGDPANALYCVRCNIPGKVDVLVVKEVDEIIDPWEGRPIGASDMNMRVDSYLKVSVGYKLAGSYFVEQFCNTANSRR